MVVIEKTNGAIRHGSHRNYQPTGTKRCKTETTRQAALAIRMVLKPPIPPRLIKIWDPVASKLIGIRGMTRCDLMMIETGTVARKVTEETIVTTIEVGDVDAGPEMTETTIRVTGTKIEMAAEDAETGVVPETTAAAETRAADHVTGVEMSVLIQTTGVVEKVETGTETGIGIGTERVEKSGIPACLPTNRHTWANTMRKRRIWMA